MRGVLRGLGRKLHASKHNLKNGRMRIRATRQLTGSGAADKAHSHRQRHEPDTRREGLLRRDASG